MKATIHRNRAKCRVCDKVLESQSNPSEYQTCSCGSIAISGGKDRLRRISKSWGDLEELSEYSLSWKDVLDCKQMYSNPNQAANAARIAGYLFFVFNDKIYRASASGAIATEKKASDLPCLIGA